MTPNGDSLAGFRRLVCLISLLKLPAEDRAWEFFEASLPLRLGALVANLLGLDLSQHIVVLLAVDDVFQVHLAGFIL